MVLSNQSGLVVLCENYKRLEIMKCDLLRMFKQFKDICDSIEASEHSEHLSDDESGCVSSLKTMAENIISEMESVFQLPS